MNEAIKLAIEKGGYDNYSHVHPSVREEAIELDSDRIILDPLFWQSLGKALGWKEPKFGIAIDRLPNFSYPKAWLPYAHKYFDLALTDGDTETFWQSLLK